MTEQAERPLQLKLVPRCG